MSYIDITEENIDSEHICCAFSDKKCSKSYEKKKSWLKQEFNNGYVFRRLDERAKVFIEYGPDEKAWAPFKSNDYLFINCFWVSGKYKGIGHGKALLQSAIDDAKSQGKAGLVTVAGKKKFHFISDGKWFKKQGFEVCDSTDYGFELLVHKFNTGIDVPSFMDHIRSGECSNKKGITVYYSNRCPFSEYHVETSLRESAEKRDIPLKIIKLKTLEEARKAPTPATIFSLFLNGKFITTDISACMESRIDKILKI